MTRHFFSYLQMITGIAFIVGGFGCFFFNAKMKLDVIDNRQVTPEESKEMYNYWKLIRIHRSIFPESGKRKLFWTSWAIFLTAWVVLIIHGTAMWHLNKSH
jgi:hypothetical protein